MPPMNARKGTDSDGRSNGNTSGDGRWPAMQPWTTLLWPDLVALSREAMLQASKEFGESHERENATRNARSVKTANVLRCVVVAGPLGWRPSRRRDRGVAPLGTCSKAGPPILRMPWPSPLPCPRPPLSSVGPSTTSDLERWIANVAQVIRRRKRTASELRSLVVTHSFERSNPRWSERLTQPSNLLNGQFIHHLSISPNV
jgi:hypothetical protein